MAEEQAAQPSLWASASASSSWRSVVGDGQAHQKPAGGGSDGCEVESSESWRGEGEKRESESDRGSEGERD